MIKGIKPIRLPYRRMWARVAEKERWTVRSVKHRFNMQNKFHVINARPPTNNQHSTQRRKFVFLPTLDVDFKAYMIRQW